MTHRDNTPARVRWARLRFSIVGPLLSCPPEPGELGAQIALLAGQSWRHPTTGEVIRISAKSIERWYYTAKSADNPIEALERKVPKHVGTFPSVTDALGETIKQQYRAHPGWTRRLHTHHLVTSPHPPPAGGACPSNTTVARFMKDQGMVRRRRRRRDRPGEQALPRERRSFEVRHVHGLWHLDFHEGSRRVLTASGEWQLPQLLGVLDDRSRLCSHLQWYLDETAESLIHGLSQAFQKRGLPRALLTDNGSAMLAAETTQGLERLSVEHHTTLPYCPEQNAKMENFWGRIEQRLMPMLEAEKSLTLDLLNRATTAWVEQEYHQREHSELGASPLQRYLEGPTVGRECPSSDGLRRAFRMEVSRAQRKSDGTVTVEGIRYELPWRYNTLRRVHLRVARWDLSSVELVDTRRGTHLATLLPVDKERNADGRRRVLAPAVAPDTTAKPTGIAPRLRELMAEYAATGLPPAFIPKDDVFDEDDE